MPQTIQGEISRSLARGIAITSLIIAVAVYMPILGFFCSLFVPLPILFYRSKLGRRAGAIIPLVSVVIMFLMLGRISIDILFFLELLLIGFVLSELLELNLSVEKTVLYTCCTVLMAGTFCLIFYSNVSQKGLSAMVSDYVTKNLELTMSVYENMGMPEESIHVLSSSLEQIRYVLIRIIPALVVSFTLFVVWTTLLMAKPILKNRDIFYPEFGPLKLWKTPEILVWGVIGCGIMLLFPDKTFKILGLNGLLILMTIYFFGGIAILSFYFEKKNLPPMLRIILYSLIALQQVVLLIVIGLGFFDMWLNFRKLKIEDKKDI
ncbi:DUF2232 domain-containing protein [Desulfococcaceae bacterium HSG8]|nr:DUF2232 domain-containing protein [Desulfococcaceae bacterium HSG8]